MYIVHVSVFVKSSHNNKNIITTTATAVVLIQPQLFWSKLKYL